MGAAGDMRPSLELNERAARMAREMVAEAATLGIRVASLEGGTRVLDCGTEVEGGLEAGRRLAEVCLGGAGRVRFTPWSLDDLVLPGVTVWTDQPALGCLGAQYAGWAVRPAGYFAMGSGPLRAIARVERELYEVLDYGEEARGAGVLVLETSALPDESVAQWLAQKSGVPADRLILLTARTASLAGGVQIAARVVETAMHRLLHLGVDVKRVVSGFGSAPVPPVAMNDLGAIGRTNDCVLYGGRVHLFMRGDDDELAGLAARLPSSASPDHGAPFREVFDRYHGDFYTIDPALFSPAEVHINNLATGHTFRGGAREPEVLRRSLLG